MDGEGKITGLILKLCILASQIRMTESPNKKGAIIFSSPFIFIVLILIFSSQDKTQKIIEKTKNIFILITSFD